MSHVYRSQKLLARVALTHPATQYVALNMQEAPLASLFLRWFDGTSSATCTLESTDLPKEGPDGVADDSTGVTEWASESSPSITGPAGAGAGCEMVNLVDKGQRRMRLKIVTVANTDIEVWGHLKG